MKEMILLFRGAVTLDDKTFADLKASPDVFKRGLMFVLVLGLFVGVVLGLVGTFQGLLTNPATEMAAIRAQIAQFIPAGQSQEFLANFDMGFRIAQRIMTEAKTPLPYPFQVFFQQLGHAVSYPFGWFGSILLYGVVIQFFAKLLGGRGTIAQMLGITSLSVAPLALQILSFVPCLGVVLGFIAWVWSIIVYIKATASAQELTIGKAIAAIALPIIIAFVLVLIVIVLLIVLSSGSR